MGHIGGHQPPRNLRLMYLRTYVRTIPFHYIPLHSIAYVHAYIRTYVRTYVHTYIDTYIHTYIHTGFITAIPNVKLGTVYTSCVSCCIHKVPRNPVTIHVLFLWETCILTRAFLPIGSMVLLYKVTWIPSIYPSHVSIFLPAPWIRHGLLMFGMFCHRFQFQKEPCHLLDDIRSGWIITASLRPNPGIMVNKRNHPKMALFQVSELW